MNTGFKVLLGWSQWLGSYLYTCNMWPPVQFSTRLFGLLHTLTVGTNMEWGVVYWSMGDVQISGVQNLNGPWTMSFRGVTTQSNWGGLTVAIGY